MRSSWGLRICLVFACSALAKAAHSFENTAIVRTVDLGGALSHVTTTYAITSLENGSKIYTFALTKDEAKLTSWIEAKVKGQATKLVLTEVVSKSTDDTVLYTVELPKALKVNESVNLVLETVQTHASKPWPLEAAQSDDQLLFYTTDLFVVSPYKTAVQRTKLKGPATRIPMYASPVDVEAFVTDAAVTKSGSTVTYGPYQNIDPSTGAAFAQKPQQKVTVQYGYDHPVTEIRTLRRAAEISHWGANLNIQDEISLYNAGPKLKGHFSRLDHQAQKYHNRLAPHVMTGLALHLPAGIRDAYYYDLIGNVSTSRLRPAASGSFGAQYSLLELRPRYPLMGGWNYTFTLGWDAPLGDSAVWDKESGKWVVAVPVMTLFPGAVIDDAEVKVILPEGATDVEVFTPYLPKETVRSTHITYLDTVGRPAYTFHFEQLTDKHQGIIYVSYKVPFRAHLKKPVSVATAFMGVFVFAIFARRVDLSLRKK